MDDVDGHQLLVWHVDLCPSCRKERDSSICHLCGSSVHPKTWEELGLNPPPWDPLIGEIETLVSRVSADRRIVLSDWTHLSEALHLTQGQSVAAELLMRSYLAGGALESQRRMDNAKAKT